MTNPSFLKESLAMAAQNPDRPTYSEALDFLTALRNKLVSYGARDISALDATVYSLKGAHTLVHLRNFELGGYPILFLDVMHPKEITETVGERSLKGLSLSIGVKISDESSPRMIDAVVACNIFSAWYGDTMSSPLQFKIDKPSRAYATTEHTWQNRDEAVQELAGLLVQYGSSDLTRQLRINDPQNPLSIFSAPKPQ